MTNQEVFNKVASHLLTQNLQAIKRWQATSGDWETQCRYKTTDGLKCAVGCLIPDEYYTESLEGSALVPQTSIWYIMEKLGYSNQLGLLSQLQGIHDMCAVHDWRKELKTLAHGNNLSAEVLHGY